MAVGRCDGDMQCDGIADWYSLSIETWGGFCSKVVLAGCIGTDPEDRIRCIHRLKKRPMDCFT